MGEPIISLPNITGHRPPGRTKARLSEVVTTISLEIRTGVVRQGYQRQGITRVKEKGIGSQSL
jgi:hypothetical protein